MRIHWLVAIVVAFCWSVSAPAHAGGRVALVIANGAYASLDRLDNAQSTESQVRAALERIGYRVTSAGNLSGSAFREALSRFAREANDADVAAVYYVGLAIQEDGENLLLPVDFRPNGAASSAIPLAAVTEAVAGAAHRVVMVDAGRATAVEGAPIGLLPVEPGENTLVAFAAAPGTVAVGGEGGPSPFAASFAELATSEDRPFNDVLKEIRNDVMRKTIGQQFPWYASTLPDDFVLLDASAPGSGQAAFAEPPPASAAGPQEQTFWEIARSFDTAAMYQDYLKRYPNGVFAATARERIALLSGGAPVAAAPPPAEPDSEEQMSQENLGKLLEGLLAGSGGGTRGLTSPEPSAPGEATPEKEAAVPLPSPAPRDEEPEPSDLTLSGSGSALGAAPSPDLGVNTGPTLGAAPPPSEPIGKGSPLPSAPLPAAPVPDAPIVAAPAPPVAPMPSAPAPSGNDDLRMWGQVAKTEDADLVRTFIARFPDSAFVDLARSRLATLEAAASPPVAEPPPVAAAPLPPLDGALGAAPPPDAPVTAGAPPPLPGDEPPAAADGEAIARHPTIDAPDKVVGGETLTVSIALTEEQFTPEVVAKAAPGQTLAPSGALRLALPVDRDEWDIDIDLLATGFDLVDGGKWSRRVTLYREGDSDFARFEVKARPAGSEAKPRKLIARLYNDGTFLGSATRTITIYPDQGTMAASDAPAPGVASLMSVAAPAASQDLATELLVGDHVDVPDMDVTVHYDDPDNLGEGLIIIHSPHIGAPVTATFTTPAGTGGWLDSEYKRLVQLGLNLRGVVLLKKTTATDAASQKRFVMKAAEGFGADLYRKYVPAEFKEVFATLRDEGRLHSIQITSNSPIIPWELIRPDAADGKPGGFLGIDYRVARWAPRETGGQVDRPLNTIAFSGVAAIAPAYDGQNELPFQKVEVDALSKLAGFRLIDGDFSSFEKLVGEVSSGFVHFSGHGSINDPGTGSPVFAIRLLDQELDPNTWRALTFAPHDKGNPFYFFNACDSGAAASLGGFVQGWGPAVLASGASGFIGGMWPLSDRAAASFSTKFYAGIADGLPQSPVYVAEVLRKVRRDFYESGDPTFLAYTFYGNANLQVTRQ